MSINIFSLIATHGWRENEQAEATAFINGFKPLADAITSGGAAEIFNNYELIAMLHSTSGISLSKPHQTHEGFPALALSELAAKSAVDHAFSKWSFDGSDLQGLMTAVSIIALSWHSGAREIIDWIPSTMDVQDPSACDWDQYILGEICRAMIDITRNSDSETLRLRSEHLKSIPPLQKEYEVKFLNYSSFSEQERRNKALLLGALYHLISAIHCLVDYLTSFQPEKLRAALAHAQRSEDFYIQSPSSWSGISWFNRAISKIPNDSDSDVLH